MLVAWNNGDLSLHYGVLPPFLCGKGLHNHWILTEVLSSNFRLLLVASWTISNFYINDLDQEYNQLIEGFNISGFDKRGLEIMGNSHLGRLYSYSLMDAAGDAKKRSREIYDNAKDSRNSRRRQLYAQARDARQKTLHAQTRAIEIRHNHLTKRRIEEGHGEHSLELQGYTESVAHQDDFEAEIVVGCSHSVSSQPPFSTPDCDTNIYVSWKDKVMQNSIANTRLPFPSSCFLGNNLPDSECKTIRKYRPQDYSHEELYYGDFYKIVGPDFVFHPTDNEIVVLYLINKIKNQKMPLHWIKLANIYEIDPEKLADEYGQTTMKVWYLFTVRDRKYQNEKISVSTIDGYWQVGGDEDESVKENGEIVGFRKTFQFYKGKPESSPKTCWIMYEFRAIDPLPPKYSHVGGQTKDWVLCKICNTEIDSESSDMVEDPDYVPSEDEEEAAP